MSAAVVPPEIEERMRQIAREEIERRLVGGADWSPEKMRAAMRRIEERRQRIALPSDEVDALIEEHRREFGRGPLVDERESESAAMPIPQIEPRPTGDRPHGLPRGEMGAVIARMEALRTETVMPHEEVEAILEEHRREFGRG